MDIHPAILPSLELSGYLLISYSIPVTGTRSVRWVLRPAVNLSAPNLELNLTLPLSMLGKVKLLAATGSTQGRHKPTLADRYIAPVKFPALPRIYTGGQEPLVLVRRSSHTTFEFAALGGVSFKPRSSLLLH